jgi:flavin-dependent dehydrogenase
MIFKKLFKYTPTTQEQQLLDIAQDLLNHPDTVVRMTFSSRKYFLTNEKDAIRVPNFLFPKTIHNYGNYVISLSKLTRWMGEQAS